MVIRRQFNGLEESAVELGPKTDKYFPYSVINRVMKPLTAGMLPRFSRQGPKFPEKGARLLIHISLRWER